MRHPAIDPTKSECGCAFKFFIHFTGDTDDTVAVLRVREGENNVLLDTPMVVTRFRLVREHEDGSLESSQWYPIEAMIEHGFMMPLNVN